MGGSFALLTLCGCGATSSATVSRPSAGASASAVLDAYLRAVVAGDCGTAHALAAPTFEVGNGDLCGGVDVKNFVVHDPPAKPTPDEVDYGTVLTT